MHREVVDGSQILVDYTRQQLMPGWIPRRLGRPCFLATANNLDWRRRCFESRSPNVSHEIFTGSVRNCLLIPALWCDLDVKMKCQLSEQLFLPDGISSWQLGNQHQRPVETLRVPCGDGPRISCYLASAESLFCHTVAWCQTDKLSRLFTSPPFLPTVSSDCHRRQILRRAA